jgi:hypothetical protein
LLASITSITFEVMGFLSLIVFFLLLVVGSVVDLRGPQGPGASRSAPGSGHGSCRLNSMLRSSSIDSLLIRG